MAAPKERKLVQVIEPFSAGNMTYNRGRIFEATDSIVRKYAAFFGPVTPVRSRTGVVQMNDEVRI